MNDTMLGTEIGRYRLTRLLGEGGMGKVYLAEQPTIGSRVAIKILSDECARNAELLERFFAEAKAVNLIRHENIISVLDLSVLPDGRPFIIMEFVEGQTLAHHVRKQAAPLGGVAQVMGEVLSGLAAAHAIGIVHRDLKPDNVLVTVEGHAKVLDFGIAKLAPGLRAEVSPRTKTGALLGTPAYMAPEQISGAGNVDPRTDIYAAGIVLYEAVTGVQPFTGNTLFDIMRAHLEEAPVPPRQRRPDLPVAIEQVILQAMAKDPEHRFQSTQAMAKALAHAAESLPPEQWQPLSTRGSPQISAIRGPSSQRSQPSSQPGERLALQSTAIAPPPTAARNRRKGFVIAALASAALAVVVVTIAVTSRGSSPPAPPTRDEPIVQAPVEPAPAGAPITDPEPTTPPSPSPSPARTPTRSTPTAPAKVNVPVDAGVAAAIPDAAVPAHSGVTIGPGVQVGPGVTIGTAKPSKYIQQPADYNSKNFDPIAYVPKALALARKLAPDARLTEFWVSRTFADGHGEITPSKEAEFRFRSPAGSKRPAGVAPNEEVELPCMIYVELTPKEVSARIVDTDDCDARFVRVPKCALASVWKGAIAEGANATHVAKISWLSDESWYLDTGSAFSGTIPDTCP